MNPEYSTKFYNENVCQKLPDQHIGVLITRTALNDSTKGKIGACYHANTDLHHLKLLLEFTLNDVNQRLDNAEG